MSEDPKTFDNPQPTDLPRPSDGNEIKELHLPDKGIADGADGDAHAPSQEWRGSDIGNSNSEPVNSSTEMTKNGEGQKQEGDPDSIVQRASNVQSSTFNQIAQQINYYPQDSAKQNEENLDTFNQIEIRSLRRIESIFVPPVGFTNQLETFLKSQSRIFVVYGQEDSGKSTLSIQLAKKLLERDSINKDDIYFLKLGQTTSSLIDILNKRGFKEKSVLIIKDVFDMGIAREELTADIFIDTIRGILRKKKSNLILTFTHVKDFVNSPFPEFQIRFTQEILDNVLSNHIERYTSSIEDFTLSNEKVEYIKSNKEKLLNFLKTPVYIDRFCKEFSKRVSDNLSQLADTIIKAITNTDRAAARAWFENLPTKNHQLYALLLALFPDLERLDFESFFTRIVLELRQDNLENFFSDPREVGLDDMIETLQMDVDEGQAIKFRYVAYREEVERQIKNHHHLLWSTVYAILEMIEEFKSPEHWQVRRLLGQAIGHLGVYHIGKLEVVFQALVTHPISGVNVVAGFALSQIATNPQHTEFVSRMVKTWVESKDPDQMWSAAAAIWHVYTTPQLHKVAEPHVDDQNEQQPLTEVLLEQLTQLGKNFDKFSESHQVIALRQAVNDEDVTLEKLLTPETADRMAQILRGWAQNIASGISFAIAKMYPASSKRIVAQVLQWLQEDDDKLKILAVMSGFKLFRWHQDPEYFIPTRHHPLLDLVHPLLSYSVKVRDRQLQDQIVHTLQSWLKVSFEHYETLKNRLIQLIHDADRESVTLITNLFLVNRPRQIDTDIDRLIEGIIGRTQLMTGFPVAKSGKGVGLILIDTSYEAQLNQANQNWGRWITEKLQSQVSCNVYPMGVDKILRLPLALSNDPALPRHSNKPRLIGPVIERVIDANETVYFICLLTWGNVIDLLDIEPLFEGRIVCVFLGGAEEEDGIPPYVMKMDPRLNLFEGDQNLMPRIQSILSKSILQYSFPEWQLQQAVFDSSQAIELLNGKVSAISTSSEDEKTKRSIELIQEVERLAACDLTAGVDLLTDWLSDTTSEIHVMIGNAAALTLINLFSQPESLFPVESHEKILKLLPALAQSNLFKQAIPIVLEASKRWASDETWCQRLLSQKNETQGELSYFIEQATIHHISKLEDLIQSWVNSTQNYSEVTESDHGVYRLIESIKLRIALNKNANLPALSNNKRYSILILDTTSRNEVSQKQLKHVAYKFFKAANAKFEEHTYPLAFRLGHRSPFITGLEDVTQEFFENIPSRRSARLILPILDRFNPDQVAFIALVTNVEPIDFEDSPTLVWEDRFIIYGESTQMVWAKQHLISPSDEGVDGTVEELVHYTSQIVGAKK